MTTTVVLVDDHDLIRQGLRRAFERAEDFAVVGEASTVAEALDAVEAANPDVVTMDVRLPDGNGIDAVRLLRATHPQLGIVVLTMYSEDDHLLGALEAGASAFVAKDAPADDVVAAARHAAVAPDAFSATDLAEAMRRRLTPEAPPLSPREREVLALLADGLGRRTDRQDALHQRVHGQDPHLEALRQARRGQPRPGPDDRDAPGADQRPALRVVNPPNGQISRPVEPMTRPLTTDMMPGSTGYEGDPGALRGRVGWGAGPSPRPADVRGGSPAKHPEKVCHGPLPRPLPQHPLVAGAAELGRPVAVRQQTRDGVGDLCHVAAVDEQAGPPGQHRVRSIRPTGRR